MKTFDEAVEYSRGRLVKAKEVVAAFEPTHVNKRRPKPDTPTPKSPAKNPKGKAS